MSAVYLFFSGYTFLLSLFRLLHTYLSTRLKLNSLQLKQTEEAHAAKSSQGSNPIKLSTPCGQSWVCVVGQPTCVGYNKKLASLESKGRR
ncbi:hypothetical protein K402DRAFT_203313 [Aulographum hederae CBS 113979]|uniref:Uncharacterized protein n=1 Tax=Aulographum hederae CBS 113979 TaxID=1176131 RepID=A0A6G1HCW1_9PEZI|nr:hypothetical protein K402DRAFT_203313 [Aulographum hederae CBS 113979]